MPPKNKAKNFVNVQRTTRPENKLHKPRVFLRDTCYVCGNTSSSAKQTINHVRRIHGYAISARQVGLRRPQNRECEYVRDRNEEYDREEMSCPSCWFHCADGDFDALYDHCTQEHDPRKVEGNEDGYESSGSRMSTSSERSNRSNNRNRSNSRKENGQEEPSGSGRKSQSPPTSEDSARNITNKLEELISIFKGTLFNNKNTKQEENEDDN